MEKYSIIASIVSVIIGGFAIWLSITFYKMSDKVSQEIKGASKDISSNVERLEKLFDKLYADTFGMMKDTYSDMRRHVWPDTNTTSVVASEISKQEDHKLLELKDEILKEFSVYLGNQKLTEEKVNSLSKEVNKLLDKAMDQSKSLTIGPKLEIAKKLLRVYFAMNNPNTAEDIIAYLNKYDLPFRDALDILAILKEKGFVHYDVDIIGPTTKISINKNH